MPIRLVKNDFPKKSCDAEVRALRIECDQNIIRTIEEERIIFLVNVPRWIDGTQGEAELLANRYTEILEQAEINNCESIALPFLFPLHICYGCHFWRIFNLRYRTPQCRGYAFAAQFDRTLRRKENELHKKY